jgi:hypothetical protein
MVRFRSRSLLSTDQVHRQRIFIGGTASGLHPINTAEQTKNGQRGPNRRRFPANRDLSTQCDVRHMRFAIRLADWKRTHWRDSKRSGDGARQIKNSGRLLEGWWHITSIARFAERKTRPASRGSARGRTTVGPVRISRTRRVCTIRYARPPRRNRR